MLQNGKSWHLELFLFPGKYRYKFVVDGEWITDPKNPQKERNEFDVYNATSGRNKVIRHQNIEIYNIYVQRKIIERSS